MAGAWHWMYSFINFFCLLLLFLNRVKLCLDWKQLQCYVGEKHRGGHLIFCFFVILFAGVIVCDDSFCESFIIPLVQEFDGFSD